MLGTFRSGDYAAIESVPLPGVRLGDVVVFRVPNRDADANEIVHRVIAILPKGLVTRGDNKPHADTMVVTADNLTGRVTHVERDGKRRLVRGGRVGLLWARTLWTWLYIRNLVVRLGRGPYRRLRRSGLVPQLWRPSITQVRLATEDGPLVKYVCGGRTVARWWPEEGSFECRRPYDLVIPRPDGAA